MEKKWQLIENSVYNSVSARTGHYRGQRVNTMTLKPHCEEGFECKHVILIEGLIMRLRITGTQQCVESMSLRRSRE
jgi:hypothetical protein